MKSGPLFSALLFVAESAVHGAVLASCCATGFVYAARVPFASLATPHALGSFDDWFHVLLEAFSVWQVASIGAGIGAVYSIAFVLGGSERRARRASMFIASAVCVPLFVIGGMALCRVVELDVVLLVCLLIACHWLARMIAQRRLTTAPR